MTQRNDEAQYIGYVDVKGKKGPEKQIVIVGMYRIIWAKPSGKVLQEAHLFDLRIITSMQPKEVRHHYFWWILSPILRMLTGGLRLACS